MVRSAHALLAVLILPGFLLAQEAPRTHQVVDGDTLWDLANAFYGNPFDWRRIWNANQSVVDNPNLIVPGQVLTIPGVEGGPTPVTAVVVEGPPAAPAAPRAAPRSTRTIFYRDPTTATTMAGAERLSHVAVSRDQVYSAPWLVPLEGEPMHEAVLTSFAGVSRSETPRAYDRVVLEPRGTALRVGDQLRAYRVTRTVRDVGDVVLPTGLLTVTDVGPDGVVALVTKEYHRMALGDLVGPLPPYGLRVGQLPEPVAGGSQAMVMGFAGPAELHDLGGMAFLDMGADQGVAVGDEFAYFNAQAGDIIEGRLQVVMVTPRMATARIVDIDDAVFEQGVVVRMTRKMP
ncbi:MAG: LysM peptidoglycan-binding domain-containing protein [Longimicrobiales bacterium]